MKIVCFSKVKQAELKQPERLSKSRYSTKLRFVSTEKSLVKNCCDDKERSPNFCLLKKSTQILEQVNQVMAV